MKLLIASAISVVALAVLSSVALAASGYGELTRFGSGSEERIVAAGKLASERTRVLGVDPTDNSVYVADEPQEAEQAEQKVPYDVENEECPPPSPSHPEGVVEEEGEETHKCVEHFGPITRHLRVQKFIPGAKGQYVFSASASFNETLPEYETVGEVEPTIEGIAVGHGRVYLLSVNFRQRSLSIDSSGTGNQSLAVASTLYAFSTTPKGTELVPAEDAKAGGVLLGEKELEAQSATPGKALLEPAGLTVAPELAHPEKDEVVILGHIDEAGKTRDELKNPGDHYALQRVREDGTLGARYVDSSDFLKGRTPDSPIVVTSSDGKAPHLYVNGGQEATRELIQVPYDFETEGGTPPSTFSVDPSGGKVVGGVDASVTGGVLTAAPEPEGPIYGTTTIGKEKTPQVFLGHLGVLELSGQNGSEKGWSGGEEAIEGNEDHCVIEPYIYGGEIPEPQVAAGSGGKLFVLATEFLLKHAPGEPHEPIEGKRFPGVVEFGEGGIGCPTSSDAGIEVAVNGIPKTEPTPTVKAGSQVDLSSYVKQADALHVKWQFMDETTKKEEAPEEVATDELHATETVHEFSETGEFDVTETIEDDDLATPNLVVSRKVIVTAPTGSVPVVKTEPANVTVVEGENATFEAAASGKPEPIDQWEVERGSGWTDDVLDSGGTTTKLTVPAVTSKENNYKYRVVFSNSEGTAKSTEATLKVISKKQHEEEVKAHEEEVKKHEAEAKRHEEEVKKKEEEASKSSGGGGGSSGGGGGGSPAPGPVTPPPGGGVLGNVEASPDAAVASSSITVSSSGTALIKVSCPAGEASCAGAVTLRTLSAVVASSTHKGKPAILTLAAGSFSAAGGQAKTVTLHLSSAGRALLARAHGLLRVRATLLAHNPSGATHTTLATITLREAKKGKR